MCLKTFVRCFKKFTCEQLSSSNGELDMVRGISYIKQSRRDAWSLIQKNRLKLKNDTLSLVTFRDIQLDSLDTRSQVTI